jgi:hypothetical protein
MRRGIRSILIILVVALAHWVPRSEIAAQATEDYVINGISAWSTAKTHGFTFQPLPASTSQTVTSPRDGVDTRLRTTQKNLFGQTETITLGQVVGGNASVNRPQSGTRTVKFRFFGDGQLTPGWTVVKVELTGSYVWDRQVGAGSRDLTFQVRASSSPAATGMAVIKAVTLRGPAGAKWADAFAGTREPRSRARSTPDPLAAARRSRSGRRIWLQLGNR